MVGVKKAKEVFAILSDKDILGLSASIAYYTVLSMTPFLLLFFAFLALIGVSDLPDTNARVAEVLGPSQVIVLNSIRTKLENDNGIFAFGVFGIVTLLFSASAVITQIQISLNLIFGLPQQPNQRSDFMIWVRNKLLSMFSLFFCVFAAASSLALSFAVQYLLPFEDQNFWNIMNILTSFAVFSLLFTLMFHYLPYRRPAWRFSIKTALLCALLFHIGRGVIEFYFSVARLESSYGALSSFIIYLLWAYYNAFMILISACFAKVYFYEKNRLPS